MPKLRFTFTGTYEADPKGYDTSDPTEMAALDQEQLETKVLNADEMMEFADDVVMKVEVVDGS